MFPPTNTFDAVNEGDEESSSNSISAVAPAPPTSPRMLQLGSSRHSSSTSIAMMMEQQAQQQQQQQHHHENWSRAAPPTLTVASASGSRALPPIFPNNASRQQYHAAAEAMEKEMTHLRSRHSSRGSSKNTSRAPSRTVSRPPSSSRLTAGTNPSAKHLLTALALQQGHPQGPRGPRRASMMALANVGGMLGGQLGDLITKIGEGVGGGSTVVPVEEGREVDSEDDYYEEDEIDKIKEKIKQQQMQGRRRVSKGPQALLGNGNESDAEKSAFTLVMLVATLFALWGTDMYELCGPPLIGFDAVLYTLVNVVLALFVVEFFFYSLFKPGYIGSFFFYLDFLSAVSLLPDSLQLWGIVVFSSGGSGLAVARAGRAARAGTRAARIVRIFKLFSLLRRKSGSDDDKNRNNTTTAAARGASGESSKTRPQAQRNAEAPSKVGTKLSDGIIQKVIVIVALMLVSSDLLDLISTAGNYGGINSTVTTDLDSLAFILNAVGGNVTAQPFYPMMVAVLQAMNLPDGPRPVPASAAGKTCPSEYLFPTLGGPNVDLSACVVRHVRIGSVDVWGSTSSYADLRTNPGEFSVLTGLQSEIAYATLPDARSDSLTNIITVLFITVLLGVASALFQRDSNTLVIAPLELMALLVKQLAQDPLHVLDIGNMKLALDSETRLVALAIVKLSQMLQVGFGEAGASIIQANMASDSDRINPVLPGRRIQGIYGFCDIRNFTDCTECLQTDVMVFVNRISDFVHKAVKDNYGAPNKNIGDAFLLVWRLPDRIYDDEPNLADSALQSFVRIIVETAADRKLLALTSRKEVQDRIPGYAVRMGFGLHVGWAIEGAIGSVLKIDATYLSPNVNMCARLEGATKTYGCVMLMTDAFYDMLSAPVQKLCRRVDRVTARGATAPFDLYTFDSVRFPDLDLIRKGKTFWERFPPTTTEAFRSLFAAGVKAYVAGDWPTALIHIDKCLETVPGDGPARFLSTLITENRGVCPANWPGYRVNGVD